jgi:hypothetical protein
LVDGPHGARLQHDEHVIQMNEVHRCASGWVQRAARKVAAMIDEPGHPTGHLVIALEDTIMLKTISAALLAVSVFAAPAMAAGIGKTSHPPVIKAVQVKTSVLNANARMGRHHHQHFRHHGFHKRMGALKTHFSKVTIKHVAPAIKRG